jgi:hypothetical protein
VVIEHSKSTTIAIEQKVNPMVETIYTGLQLQKEVWCVGEVPEI